MKNVYQLFIEYAGAGNFGGMARLAVEFNLTQKLSDASSIPAETLQRLARGGIKSLSKNQINKLKTASLSPALCPG